MKKRIIAIFIVIILILSCSACSALTGQTQMKIKFDDTEGGKKLVLFEGTSKEIEYTIPDELDGQPIVEIGDFAVANSEILETLKIGKNIKTISNRGIVNNKVLENIIVDSENPYFKSVDGVLFNYQMTELIAFPNMGKHTRYEKVGENEKTKEEIWTSKYTVPESVEKISEMAFYKCAMVGMVILPSTLKSIDEMAFFRCWNMKFCDIPDKVEIIERDAFGFCGSLTDIFIPASVTKIGAYAFCDVVGPEKNRIRAVRFERPSKEGVELGIDWMPFKETAKTLLYNQTRGGK